MATTIKLKNGSGAPLAGDLVQGEPALDLTNKRLYTEDAGGNVIEVGTNPTELQVDNININGNTIISTDTNGNIAITPNGTGEVDISKVDIDGGTIDGTIIGGASAAAGTFTTVTASGEIAANGGIALGDNDKITFGAGDDLEIYHDGSNSRINDVGTGYLSIDTNGSDIRLTSNAATEFMAKFEQDGPVTLYHNNAAKLATAATGIDVTGTITADGLTVDGDVDINATNTTLTATQPRIWLIESDETDVNTLIRNIAGDFEINTVPNNKSGATLRFNLDHSTGDISFYEDTGTTPKLFWDASAESLGIGTTSPQAVLTTSNSGALTLDCNDGDHSGFGLFIAPSTINTNTVNSAIGFGSVSGRKYAAIGMQTYADADQTGLNFYVQPSASGSTAILTEAMRIDKDGNLLVGTTATGLLVDTSGTGVQIAPDNIQVLADENPCLYLNRLTSDGDILSFRKDGAVVGSIGARVGDLYLGTGDTGITFADSVDSIRPVNTSTQALRDAAIDIGASAYRFKDLYLSGGVYVGGTTSANLLDDYEEGEWTPSYAPETNSFGAISYNIQRATYTKVGRIVHCVCSLRTSSITVGTASGFVYLTGLPFTSSSDADAVGYWASAVHSAFVNAPSNIKTRASETNVEIQKGNNNTNLVVADLTTASTGNFLAVSFSYVAAS